jgi:hypothetical protein
MSPPVGVGMPRPKRSGREIAFARYLRDRLTAGNPPPLVFAQRFQSHSLGTEDDVDDSEQKVKPSVKRNIQRWRTGYKPQDRHRAAIAAALGENIITINKLCEENSDNDGIGSDRHLISLFSQDRLSPSQNGQEGGLEFQYRSFGSSAEQMLYITSRINVATHSVCDITWVDRWGYHRNTDARQAADRLLHEAVLSFSKRRPYVEILVFDKEYTSNRSYRVELLRSRIGRDNAYHCAYLTSDWPRLQFIIIDDEVILRSTEGGPTSSKAPADIRCAIASADLSTLFRSYFARLWHAAKILKDEDGRDDLEIEQFFKLMNSGSVVK